MADGSSDGAGSGASDPDGSVAASDGAVATGDAEVVSVEPRRGVMRRLVGVPARHPVLSSVAALVVVAVGVVAWTQVKPLLDASRYEEVRYSVPTAPRLTAYEGETVYRIDPTQSSMSYAIDEHIVGQDAGTARGSTNGIAGDVVINSADPDASRIGRIVVNVEQLHSDNSLRDARIRADFLESHHHPLATFDTDKITGLPSELADGRSYDFEIAGRLTVKHIEKPVTWKATATLADGQLTATARTTVKLSDFDAGPISLVGLVSTDDAVQLQLSLTALDPTTNDIPTRIAAPVADAGDGGPSFSKKVQPILEASCASCHNPGEVGAEHWKLDTAGDAAEVATGIGTVTKAKYMPPWPASDVGVPLLHSKALTSDEIATLGSWAAAGGPLDVPASTKVRAKKGSGAPEPRHDVVLQMPEAYTGTTENDNDYRCFVLDPHLTEPTYMTGYEVLPDERQEIHHTQIFHIDATAAAAGVAKSGQDGRPGWSCYGGPSLPTAVPTTRPTTQPTTQPTATVHQGVSGQAIVIATPDSSAADSTDSTHSTDAPTTTVVKKRKRTFTGQAGLIAGWVPGQDPVIYPEGAGVLLQPGDALVLQMHYHYDHGTAPSPDRTSVALQLDPGTTPRKQLEVVNPLGPVEIPCLPGATAPLCDRAASMADNAARYGGFPAENGLLALCGTTPEKLTAGFTGVAHTSCDSEVPADGTIVGAMGHMHTLGKSFRLTLDPDTPHEKVLLDIPTWNFDWQMNYGFKSPIHVTAGQRIRMDCTWDRAIDPTREQKYIVFAEGTEDEMCFSTYSLIPDAQP